MHLARRVVGVVTVTLEQVSLRHGRTLIVEGVSAQFGPGLSAIAGANGAGKTSLLRAIAGLHPISAGRISGAERPDRLGFLPQSVETERRFPITCRDFAALGAWGVAGAQGAMTRDILARVDAALVRMQIAALAERPILRLSSGQFQRLMFARLMVQDTPILLLDEPFTAVDSATEALLLDQLLAWRDEGRVVIAVLHDHDLIRAFFPTTLLLHRDGARFGASATVLTQTHRFARNAA